MQTECALKKLVDFDVNRPINVDSVCWRATILYRLRALLVCRPSVLHHFQTRWRQRQGVETHGDVAKVAADLSPGDTATASSLNTPRRQAGRLSLGDTICMAKAVAKLFEMIRKLRLSDDRLTLSGQRNLGYCAARGTHMVSKGKWYYEVRFDRQAPQSHIRIGFAQELLPLQACIGYTKLSYGFRSKCGTKFHDCIGTRYLKADFKEGDVLGCLIDIPEPKFVTSEYLPQSKKDMILVFCKSHMFYEQKDDLASSLKKLKTARGSKIEFFLNGKSCGVAYTNIYAGQYYPAVSIYQESQITCNFGPRMKYLPAGARPFTDRLREYAVEQTVSDMLGTLEWREKQIEEKKNNHKVEKPTKTTRARNH
ncbi:hypothetical protein L596_000721 [Steinernema carpocapsae]|uniref:B30.2/SPRY domain-containing protein n=1 Tax=Steinernema carpocapsae TaxID=34508 RepID=A0A4U8UIY5_STECR|nr:hypothetical protein L596_000721 [Steinernema carpocapsae]